MEAAAVSRAWDVEDGLPPCMDWKGPLSDINVMLVRRGSVVHLACMSQHKTVPYKYSFEKVAIVGGVQIWPYCRNTTGDLVAIREIPPTPIVVQISVVNNQILGYLLSGRLVFVHDIGEVAIVRACHIRHLVADTLVQSNLASRFRSLKLIDEAATELKGRRVIARTRLR